MSANENAIAKALAKNLPSVADLFGPEEVSNLAKAWEDGISRAFPHPFIETLLGDHYGPRRTVLDAGMKLLRDQGNDLKSNVKRLTLKSTNTAAFTGALGSMNELWAAATCAAAGAEMTFHATGPGKTPDIGGKIRGEDFTLEVTSLGLPTSQVSDGNRLKHDFRAWKKGSPVPKTLRGHASDHGHVRTLQMGVSILGDGDIDARVQTLAGKKTSAQLRGHPNPVLVISGRHQWGISSEDCLPRRHFNGGFYTGVCHAATYGRKDDYLFAGEEFDGRGQEVVVQSKDGILRKSKTISAVLFLFHGPRDVLFENLQSSAGFSSRSVARFFSRAFDVDPTTSIIKQR